MLSPELALRSLEELLHVDRDTLGEPWGPAHFLAERPDKWRWSRLSVDREGRVEGFVIASRKGDAVHCHRVAVRSDLRSQGVGAAILRAVAGAAASQGVERIACKVARENERAVHWYLRLGFLVTGEELANFLLAAPATAILQNTADHASPA